MSMGRSKRKDFHPTTYRADAVEAEPMRLNTQLGMYTSIVNRPDLAAVAVLSGFRV
jgi:allophanate hydrolase